jgi:hypothetical protein
MKVFISSTYKDLIEYRAAAIRAVEGTNYQASKMEVFGARSDEPLNACLKEVEESDFFLGIYTHRYGYVPVGRRLRKPSTNSRMRVAHSFIREIFVNGLTGAQNETNPRKQSA